MTDPEEIDKVLEEHRVAMQRLCEALEITKKSWNLVDTCWIDLWHQRKRTDDTESRN